MTANAETASLRACLPKSERGEESIRSLRVRGVPVLLCWVCSQPHYSIAFSLSFNDGLKNNHRIHKECIMPRLYHVSVVPGIHYDCLATDDTRLEDGCEVVVRCQNHDDFGMVSGCRIEDISEQEAEKRYQAELKGRKMQGRHVPRIRRRATLQDRSRVHERQVMASSMHRTARQKIDAHGLPMKLLNSHVSYDGKLAIFQFVAEGRVDFRNLLRDLSGEFHMRVELRQVGVRDEAAIQGGLGTCGRPFCCATFLDQFKSVNVRMAKNQGLSLNPANISGACGRLKCCLRYEDEFYAEKNREYPRPGCRCETPCGKGRVVDRNVLTGKLRVNLDDEGNECRIMPAEEVTPIKGEGGRRERTKGERSAERGEKTGGKKTDGKQRSKRSQ